MQTSISAIALLRRKECCQITKQSFERQNQQIEYFNLRNPPLAGPRYFLFYSNGLSPLSAEDPCLLNLLQQADWLENTNSVNQ